MANSYPNQQHFGTGVISPRLQGRTQEEFYQNALAESINWQVTPQGSLRYRGGFALLKQLENKTTKLFNFSRANREDVMITVDKDNLTVLNKQGEKEDQNPDNNNLFRDPEFLAGKAFWNTESYGLNGFGSVDINQTDFITYGEGALAPQILVGRGCRLKCGTKNSDTVSAVARISQKITNLVPNRTYKVTFKIKYANDNLTRKRSTYFDRFAVIYYDNNPSDNFKIDSFYFNYSGSLPINNLGPLTTGQTYIYEAEFTCPVDTTQVNFLIEYYTLIDSSLGQIDNFQRSVLFYAQNDLGSFNAFDLTDFRCDDLIATRDVAEFTSPFDNEEKLSNIQVATDTASGLMVFTCGEVAPFFLSESATGFYEIKPVVDPSEWEDLGWGNDLGFPRCCEFFQGRLWLASTKRLLSTIWASEVADFTKFSSDENAADDPMKFTLRTNGVINWLRGNKVLLIGTDRSEWIATSQTGVITNDDFNFTEQSRLGSVSDVPPQYVSDQIAYVGLDRRRVRTINFDGDRTNTWASEEISLQAEHLFNDTIKDFAYARDPSYMLACALGSGRLAVCMHDRITSLNAWYTFVFNGNVKQIEFSNDPAGSSLWIVVERLNQYSNEIITTLEKMEALNGQLIHLDSWTVRDVTQGDENGVGAFSSAFSSGFDGQGINVKKVDGLEVFNLLTMGCVLEVPDQKNDSGTKLITHPDIYVSNGTAKLDYEGDIVNAFIGHKYQAKATTLPLEIGNPQGTGQGTKRHFNRIFAELVNNSAIPRLNTYRAKVETDEDNILDARIDGEIEVRNEGTLERGVIVIEQELPLETEITSVYGKATGSAT